jgi:hypothetical protein
VLSRIVLLEMIFETHLESLPTANKTIFKTIYDNI